MSLEDEWREEKGVKPVGKGERQAATSLGGRAGDGRWCEHQGGRGVGGPTGVVEREASDPRQTWPNQLNLNRMTVNDTLSNKERFM